MAIIELLMIGIGRNGQNDFYLFAKFGDYRGPSWLECEKPGVPRGTFLDASVYFYDPCHGALVFRGPSAELLKEDQVVLMPTPGGSNMIFSSDEMIRLYELPVMMKLALLRQIEKRLDPTIEYEMLREIAERVELDGFLQSNLYAPTDRRYFYDIY